jgi:hypothetical protein
MFVVSCRIAGASAEGVFLAADLHRRGAGQDCRGPLPGGPREAGGQRPKEDDGSEGGRSPPPRDQREDLGEGHSAVQQVSAAVQSGRVYALTSQPSALLH